MEEKIVEYNFFKNNCEEIKQNLKELKVIYTDLDGTLFNHKGCVIKDHRDDYYFDALELLPAIADKNLDVVLVSGRNKFQLKYSAQIIGLKNYISELGAELVYNLGEEVYVTFDHNSAKYDLTYGGKDLKKIIEILKENFPRKIEGKMEWSRYRSYNALLFGEIDLPKANEILKAEGYKGLTLVDNGLSSLEKLDLDIERLHIYNLMPSGVNKSNGIKLDKKIRNFDVNNCIALGDSMEDLKMAFEVKYLFLMRNALEHEDLSGELNKYDNVYITEGFMNRGWTEVIEYLLN
ncbi:MAG: HAD-IIB family hydrolase [Actinomycetota bacterium]|nr:HAD-IIB family hydrolase [Actinomycetota bacterium]